MRSKFFVNTSNIDIKADKHHPLYFMINFYNSEGSRDTLQDYVTREQDYDLAFCSAWGFVFGNLDNKAFAKEFLFGERDKTKATDFSKQANYLINYLDEIQKKSLQHLPKSRKLLGGYQHIHGRAELNWYSFCKDWTADEKGVRNLAAAILNGDKQGFNVLHINLEETHQFLLLQESGLYLMFTDGYTSKFNWTNEDIIERVVLEFNKGKFANGYDRLILKSVKNAKERLSKEQELVELFLNKMQEAHTDQAKIETIAATMQDLMQLHLYYDGNGRSLFIFANWLFWLLDMPLFYPSNMCIFDGNSLEKMHSEIIQGQKRFAEMFLNESNLTECLKKYQDLIQELSNLITNSTFSKKDLDVFTASFKSRNLNLLFRQSAVKSDAISVLKFILENAEMLNVDIDEKGKVSGKDAFDVAQENGNALALDELMPHLRSEQAETGQITQASY